MNSFTILRRSLSARLFSTVTTTIMVAVAAGLMLLLLSMRDAAQDAFNRGSGNMELLVSAEPSPMVAVLNCIFYANPPSRWIPMAKCVALGEMPPVEWAIPTQQGDSFRGMPVLATTPEFFTKFEPEPGHPWQFAEGAPFTKELQVVVGSTVERMTGLHMGDHVFFTHGIGRMHPTTGDIFPAGQKVVFAEEDPNQDEAKPHLHTDFVFEVVGILKPTGSSHDRALFCSIESAWLLHAHDRKDIPKPPDTVAELTESDKKITGIYVRCKSEMVIPRVTTMLRTDPATPTVANPAVEIKRLFTIIANVDIVFRAMAAVVMFGSLIGIMLAMYNSMEQRRRQIAVLRVLGFSRQRILALVLGEAVVIGVMGALAGLALSWLGGLAVARVMLEHFGVFVEPNVMGMLTVYVLGATVVLACVAGVVPAVMAYRTPVARNLRPLG